MTTNGNDPVNRTGWQKMDLFEFKITILLDLNE